MAVKSMIPFLVGMMLLTGVCNTILTKYQDMVCVRNCDSPDKNLRKNFEQPVWQTIQMFIGEMGCWLVVAGSALYRRFSSSDASRAGYEPVDAQPRGSLDGSRDGAAALIDDAAPITAATPAMKPTSEQYERVPMKGRKVLLLALPACCDLTATTLMNVGLLLVAASIYQMTRGALVLFVGLFSVIFLGRRLPLYKWMALFVVTGGVCIVGLAGVIQQKPAPIPGNHNPPSTGSSTNETVQTVINIARAAVMTDDETSAAAAQTLLGILLIFGAQIFTASQFVLEEAIMHRYSLTPLAVVGWEGTFGLIFTVLVQIILHFAVGRTSTGRGGYFDASTGWHDMTDHTAVWVSSLLIMVSIGGFNYFGLSVTRTVSATSRSTIDTCRTLFIWMISLGLGWESFKWLQVIGFAGLVYGTFVFNEIIRAPSCACLRRRPARSNEQPSVGLDSDEDTLA